MRILVVDDDYQLCEFLELSLSQAGHEVVAAYDGESALALLQQEPIRLVITDWMMPKFDGLELIQKIRKEIESYTYVILLTVKGEKADVIKGLENGADDYITKPFHIGELKARIAVGERFVELEMQYKEALAQLEQEATHDSLTGLYNRQQFFRLAKKEFERERRYKRPLSAIMFDLDDFKNINDTYGHLIGDQILHEIAQRCQHYVRELDILGRYGGDEFVIILPETELQAATQVAERLRDCVSTVPVDTQRGQVFVTISSGVSKATEATTSISDLLDRADLAMYAAKQAGRNRVYTNGFAVIQTTPEHLRAK